eukprot:4496906-Pyramimonas_sp.AAC.1
MAFRARLSGHLWKTCVCVLTQMVSTPKMAADSSFDSLGTSRLINGLGGGVNHERGRRSAGGVFAKRCLLSARECFPRPRFQ